MKLFSTKPSSILYLRRQDAVLVNDAKTTKLAIPNELVHNLEVQDEAKLVDYIASFLEKHSIRNEHFLLVLDATVVFQSMLPAKSPEATDLEKDFASKLPFASELQQILKVNSGEHTALFGVNKQLYQSVAEGIRRANKLKYVVPVAVYGIEKSQHIEKKDIAVMLQDHNLRNQANFLMNS